MEWKNFTVETPNEEKEYLIYYQPFLDSKFHYGIGKYILNKGNTGTFFRATGGANNSALVQVGGTIYWKDTLFPPAEVN